MQTLIRSFAALAAVAASAIGAADGYSFRVVAGGLDKPTGIAVAGQGPNATLYFTEVPAPGMPGMGNAVWKMNLGTGARTLLHMGEPDPQNIAVDKFGNVYWTCRSAGVILEQSADGATTSLLLAGLSRPTGIGVDLHDNVYFTQVPTPGVPGGMGGTNTVNVFDGSTIHALTTGEPEPTDIVVDRQGTAYWTCKSANVILQRPRFGPTSLLVGGLDKPVGIALDHTQKTLYFTEVPTPGVPGTMGGRNRVWELDLRTRERTLVHFGDPEPTDVCVAKNRSVFWTCTSAGVIVEARPI